MSENATVPEYKWTRLENHPITAIHVEGELDQDDKFKPVIEIADRPDTKHLVLFMENVSYINSRGVGDLIALQSAVNKKGYSVFIVSPSESVAEILSLMGVDSLFPIKESLKDVIQDVKG